MVQTHKPVRVRCLNTLLLFVQYVLNALLEARDQSSRELPLVIFHFLFLDKSSLAVILDLLPFNLGFQIVDQVKAPQQILLKVTFDEIGEISGPFLTFVKGVLDEPSELLIVILCVMHCTRSFAHWKTSYCLLQVLRSHL